MTFWALAEIVRQRLGIGEEDPAPTAAAKLEEGLNWLIDDPVEQAYVGLRLGRLLGVPAPGDDGGVLAREELFAGWRIFFERLAATQPVVLLVEDAQYADVGLLDFLDHLIDWVRDLPVYVVVFARPELSQVRPGFGTGRNRVTLTLDPLDSASMDRLADALVPGMPVAARARITSQAQGIPLFAVETVRSLIDRDIVQPVEGVYRLTGNIGELVVPGSLHALLAARLDALPQGTRRLISDAAVLGSTFPAEALIAISERDEDAVRNALAELLHREVLTVSADPLSPERGSYRFAQEMLRQVAYDTLSRRDRKARHLTVAAHLRAAFADDGEEVTDVIARHYLDALNALPDAPDASEIRGRAVTTLIRAAERAKRIGSPSRAADNYATAAGLSASGGRPDTAMLWESAAKATVDSGENYSSAMERASRARELYLERDHIREAARAQAISGWALRQLGRFTEAREQLTAAVEILGTDPDADTARALEELAVVATFAGAPDADEPTTEAVILGQSVDIDTSQLSGLLLTRGIYLYFCERGAEATAYLRESARLAEEAADYGLLGSALLNLGVAMADSVSRAEVFRAAASHLRRVGHLDLLAYATGNLADALVGLGDWDAADAELAEASASSGLAEQPAILENQAELAAMRGDHVTASAILAKLRSAGPTEEPQQLATLSTLQAVIALARGDLEDVLRHARAALDHAGAVGLSALAPVWSLASRAAFQLRDSVATSELLAMLDSHSPGRMSAQLSALGNPARARLAGRDGNPEGEAAFTSAIKGLRGHCRPYDLAHGLLDYAEHLVGRGEPETADLSVSEAHDIAERLRCRPLLDRAAAIERAKAGVTT